VEVEHALVSQPAVAEAAAVAAPDAERGSVVRAVIVLRQEALAEADGSDRQVELIASIQRHCREVTAPYKYPRQIEFVEALPKTSSGKIRRSVLRDDD
jgi:acetyl-CoA synthetase